MQKEHGYVYIMASHTGTLYVGVTSDLIARVYKHRNGLIDGFSKKYRCKKLVYFEVFDRITDAIAREKQFKNWRREKKEFLIRKMNPDWRDMTDDWRT